MFGGIAVALAVLSLVSTGMFRSPTAMASSEAWHDGYSWLFSPATVPSGGCQEERRIKLASGDYLWRQFIAPSWDAHDVEWNRRTIRLAAGWYTWSDCISPTTTGWNLHRTWLDRDPRGGAARMTAYWWPADGLNHWGSALRLIPPQLTSPSR